MRGDGIPWGPSLGAAGAVVLSEQPGPQRPDAEQMGMVGIPGEGKCRVITRLLFGVGEKKGLELGKSDSSKPNKSTKQLDPARGVGNNKTLLNRQL